MSAKHNQVVEKEIEKVLEAVIIVMSSPVWYSPILIASKIDEKPMFCVDYRALNQVNKPGHSPLPKVE